MSTVEYGFPTIGGLMPVSKVNESTHIYDIELSPIRDGEKMCTV